MNEKIELGDRVKDKITGLKGVAVGVTYWLYGCRRFVLQPEEGKDGKPAETFVVDEPQLDLVKKGVVQPPQVAPLPEPVAAAPRRHGPRNDPGRMNDPKRM